MKRVQGTVNDYKKTHRIFVINVSWLMTLMKITVV
jgi:hypothetical protein